MDNKAEDGSISSGSDFEVIEETEEEESQQQQPTEEEVEEDGQHQSMVATKDVNVPTATGNELELDNFNLGLMLGNLEKQQLEERLLTYEMKVAKLEAEKSELNTKLEMMELKASKSGEENELLKQKLEQFGTSIGKLEELKLNARLGEEFQAFKEVVLEQAKQQAEKSALQQNKLKEAILQSEAKLFIKMTGIRRELQTAVASNNKVATALGTQGKENADLKGTVGELVRALDQQSTKTKQLDLQLTKFMGDIDKRLDNKLPANQIQKQSNQPQLQQETFMYQTLLLVQFPVFRLIAGDNDNHGSGSAAWKFCNDFLTVTKLSSPSVASIVAERPFPVAAAVAQSAAVGRRLLFYFEVIVLQLKGPVSIGLCSTGFPLMGDLVGDRAGSFAIDSSGKYGTNGHWQKDGLPGGFVTGNVVGFGMLLCPVEVRSRIFFTKNGQLLGKQFPITSEQMKDDWYPAEQMKGDWYPAVSAYHAGTAVKVNLGGNLAADPFHYNLSHLKQISI